MLKGAGKKKRKPNETVTALKAIVKASAGPTTRISKWGGPMKWNI